MNMKLFYTLPWLSALSVSLEVAGEPVPQLDITPMGTTELRVSWPGSRSDFVLEGTGRLAPLSVWQSIPFSLDQVQQRCTVTLPVGERQQFFRLRYESAVLRTATPAIVLSLEVADSTNVHAGDPFSVEVRASYNSLLAGIAFRVAATGDPRAVLVQRIPRPTGREGLLFLPATEQELSGSHVAVDLGAMGARRCCWAWARDLSMVCRRARMFCWSDSRSSHPKSDFSR